MDRETYKLYLLLKQAESWVPCSLMGTKKLRASIDAALAGLDKTKGAKSKN